MVSLIPSVLINLEKLRTYCKRTRKDYLKLVYARNILTRGIWKVIRQQQMYDQHDRGCIRQFASKISCWERDLTFGSIREEGLVSMTYKQNMIEKEK